MLGRFRWAFLGSIAGLFILLGLATQHGSLLALAVPFVVFLAAGFYRPLAMPQLLAVRSVSASRVQMGETVTVRLGITNRGPHVEELEIADPIPPCLEWVEGDSSAAATLKPADTLQLEYTVRGHRGFAQWDQLRATVGDHLGLQRRPIRIHCPGHLFILPSFPKVYEVEIRPRRTRVYSGTVRTQVGGPGVEFFGVRDYCPGDALRHLNWKATARRDQPTTNEFEQERIADIGIILDARRRTEVCVHDQSLFESSVAAAASLGDFFMARGNRVGLLIYGSHIDWTFPGFGRIQREKLLQALARTELSDRAIFEDLENIPTRLFPARSQLVLISPLLADDVGTLLQLRALYHVIVVSPNPILFELAHLAQTDAVAIATRIASLKREVILSQLRQAGIRLVDWDTRIDLPFPVEQALGRHTLRHVPSLRGGL